MIYAGAKSEGQQSNWSIIFSAREYRSRFDKFDKFFPLYPKGHRRMSKNTCSIILYTLSLKKKIHTCIIACNTTLVRHID